MKIVKEKFLAYSNCFMHQIVARMRLASIFQKLRILKKFQKHHQVGVGSQVIKCPFIWKKHSQKGKLMTYQKIFEKIQRNANH